MTIELTPPAVRRPHWIRTTLRTPLGILAALGLLVLTTFAIIGPIVWGEQAVTPNPMALSQGPSAEHIFGTDAAGRDVFARTMAATRLSVLMALGAVGLGVGMGVVLGTLPALLPRWAGRILVAILNFAIAFPALLLAIFLLIIFGKGSGSAVLAVGIALAPAYARLTHTLTSSIAGREFIDAARVLGVSRAGLLFRHILPNVREPLIVNASISLGNGLIAFAGLSFLGLGIQPPEFDWGRMLNEGLSKIFVNPATALAPGIAVVLAGLIFTLTGEAIARGTGVQRSLPRRRPALRLPAASAPQQPIATDAVLDVQNLTVTVPAGDGWSRAVDGVSFRVAAGEAVGIVGESGSGKSLTCLSVAQLTQEPVQVTADSIRFAGTQIAGAGRAGARQISKLLGTRMAMVFQDPMSSLNPALRVGAQVAEIGWLHEGLTRSEAGRKAVQRLKDVKIPDAARRAKQLPHEFSGGMRQRAMIAMGLMGSPSLIIADEPTTALDVTVQHEVLRLLHDVRAETGAALLLISHDMAVVTGVCTRVLVMYQGHLVEDIATDDLLAGRATHPYTRALLAAVPTMTTDRDAPLATIDDEARARFAAEAETEAVR
ncbi:ABC-type dipeptide/oligopeptide/nickel transport system ATPase component/ABC-type dipeptide/oligopeptide/nickel transport system permease subunit [Microbacterium keratanolyticum]|uniref:Peptide ABC transporter ATP-binding protein n=1 Tax=Microbacterium keratanolyticum TaxID=67574 RepID=A0A9W6M800_9MICO|nr:dipeptide/oligopeptide/nickel ABC transporter permease/ATP-binding protein [Microbacterium keratanolyticum]MBM7468636.1 ABC-type dipeptide/oligopeptide/nickel transport system ATPase component/ABC-type dipeptide/oligopeptide/nickel transport system permease subunit [Microbacterium keratanolyticum]GLK00711.1 peptide ABC transporter ATP-binding protein [Microbacterium keratanolyticum]